MNPRILRKTLVSAVAGATLASPVFSQNVLEEVVVVAQKREQNLQEVPIAINAFTGRQMNALGVSESFDIAAFSPLSFLSLIERLSAGANGGDPGSGRDVCEGIEGPL